MSQARKRQDPIVERLAVVETRLDSLEVVIEDVKKRVTRIEDRTWYILAGVILTVLLALAKLFV